MYSTTVSTDFWKTYIEDIIHSPTPSPHLTKVSPLFPVSCLSINLKGCSAHKSQN